jgi:hypothetical protein
LQTINLDNTAVLEKRLREEQKKKLGLRGEISRVRAERQNVALRMDEVRIRHERESKLAQVNEFIFKISELVTNTNHRIEILSTRLSMISNSRSSAERSESRMTQPTLLKKLDSSSC